MVIKLTCLSVTIEQASVCLYLITCRTWLSRGRWLRYPKIPLILITTHYYMLLHASRSLSALYLPELCTTKYSRTLIHETVGDTSLKGGSVRSAHHLHPREAVWAIAWLSQLHWFKERGLRQLLDVLREFLGAARLGWSQDPWSAMKCSVWLSDTCCYILLHIILYYCIDHYYVLLCSLFLHC